MELFTILFIISFSIAGLYLFALIYLISKVYSITDDLDIVQRNQPPSDASVQLFNKQFNSITSKNLQLETQQNIIQNTFVDIKKDLVKNNESVLDTKVTLDFITDNINKTMIPIGTILAYSGESSVPSNFTICDGKLLSVIDYRELSIILNGKFNKGDETPDQFRVPDLRGIFIRGFDNDKGIDRNRKFGSVQDQSIQNHSHTFNPNVDCVSGNIFCHYATIWSTVGWINNYDYSTETRPKNIALNYIIKIRNVYMGTL